MSQTPPRIFSSREHIDAIERWIVQLDDEARVRVTLEDGSVVEGTVSARPTLEVFRDRDGNEGHNALLRLDDLERPETAHHAWLGDIREVEQLRTA
ncbi:DUF3247 family protein [Luteimonas sp. XNQY3]|nr:DUF3247 family protein [Luteimonas sp. XNQY3]MCD9006512.1 DUF3247 family protein [Luteimonas sp. XNQY3]